jgi:hypothetical protein
MAFIHDEHCHAVKHKKTGDFGIKNTGKSSDAGSRTSGHKSGGISHGGASNRRVTVTERRPDMADRRTRRALEISRPGSRRLASTQRRVRARSTIFPTVLTLEKKKLLSCCPSTRKREMSTRRRRTSKLWATTERRMTTEMARPRISRRRSSESRSRYWQTQAQTSPIYRAVLWRTQGIMASL